MASWFNDAFGFVEKEYLETQKMFELEDDGQILISKANGRRFHVGPFECPTLASLHGRLESLGKPSPEVDGGLNFSNVAGDVASFHHDPKNAGSIFQVASQFNCLEMVGPRVRAEDGITRYHMDHTQGPTCAMTCAAGTVFRNYFVNGRGQKDAPVDTLDEFGEVVGNSKSHYWKMSNGYALPTEAGTIGVLSEKLKADPALAKSAKSALKVGVHWDTEVSFRSSHDDSAPGHRVCQVFSAAVPISYSHTRPKDWEGLARVILDATYESTFAVGAIMAMQEKRRVKVFLTSIGGGVFGNPGSWIMDSIKSAFAKFIDYPLDVHLINYGSIVDSHRELETYFKKVYKELS
eukprot:TRINITY_DN5090_c0_g1_i1.p1 TRINITY_DN5090_c0_g1~~TRINITY_DN5090_c0_g1_i1.p1  ORF type:complete len:377 (-),score=85.15 TRINITY_DN5090_c0_g1_i1:58-1104(-)